MYYNTDCFKAYDIRGELGKNIDGPVCYRIGRAFAKVLKTKTVVLGFDARLSSPELAEYTSRGLKDQGVEVLSIGLCGTEEIYWATTEFEACGGIMITASHNPINYNGMKMVKDGSKPLETNTEFLKIKALSGKDEKSFEKVKEKGIERDISEVARKRYVAKIMSFFEEGHSHSLKVVVNSGNGAAGPTFLKIQEAIAEKSDSLEFIHLFNEPNGEFPNGIPNPILVENHAVTGEAIRHNGADLGIAFDGDFDRCFFFDEAGNFVQGEYLVGLIAEVFLKTNNQEIIVHDPRVIWNTLETIKFNEGISKLSKTGHAFIKQAMRASGAIYGGEMSAHHYFREFSYCDSGMIPWILILNLLSRKREKLSSLIRKRKILFPSSGEINFSIKDPEKAIRMVTKKYSQKIIKKDNIDGLSMEFSDWRFNLRSSNTEPVIRLNVESRGNQSLLKEKVKEIGSILMSS